MTEDEMKSLAQEFAEAHMEDFPYQTVADDPYLAQTSREDLEDLYELITTARVTLSWPEKREPLEAGALFKQALIPGIHADMIAHSGEVLPFEFTDAIIDGSGRIWHGFVVDKNPEDLTLYACLERNGSVRVEQEIPE